MLFYLRPNDTFLKTFTTEARPSHATVLALKLRSQPDPAFEIFSNFNELFQSHFPGTLEEFGAITAFHVFFLCFSYVALLAFIFTYIP